MGRIEYVCYDCGKKLKLSGFDAVNEIGRKYCSFCGSNDDDLEVIGKEEYDKAVKS